MTIDSKRQSSSIWSFCWSRNLHDKTHKLPQTQLAGESQIPTTGYRNCRPHPRLPACPNLWALIEIQLGVAIRINHELISLLMALCAVQLEMVELVNIDRSSLFQKYKSTASVIVLAMVVAIRDLCKCWLDDSVPRRDPHSWCCRCSVILSRNKLCLFRLMGIVQLLNNFMQKTCFMGFYEVALTKTDFKFENS